MAGSVVVDATGFTMVVGDITARGPRGVAPVGTKVSLMRVPLPDDAVQAGATAAGGAFDISFEGGAQPAMPVTIEVELEATPAAGAPLAFIIQDSETGLWEGLPVSIEGTTASVQLSHFSIGFFSWFGDLANDFADEVLRFAQMRHDPPDCHGQTPEIGGRVYSATTDNEAIYVCVQEQDARVLLTVHSNSPYVWEVRPDTATAHGVWAGQAPLEGTQVATVAAFNLLQGYNYDTATVLVPGGRAPVLLHEEATSTTAVARVDAGLGLIAIVSAGLGMLANAGVHIPYESLVSVGECAAAVVETGIDPAAVEVIRTVLGCFGTAVSGVGGMLVAGLVSLAPLLATQITGFIGEFTGANTARVSVTSEAVGQAGPAPDFDIEGTWVGDVNQPGSPPYSVRVTIRRAGDQFVADVTYPELSCSGDWTQTDQSTGSLTFLEVIAPGSHSCVLEVPITITMRSDGSLGYHFTHPTSTAILQRDAGEASDLDDDYPYRLFQGVDRWEVAQAHCASEGGYLAVIDTADEDARLFSWLLEQGVSSAYFGYHLNDADEWKWVVPNDSTYENWAPGEPNNERGQERYGMYYWQFSDGTWNDGDFGAGTASDPTNFICEFDDLATAAHATIP